MGDRSPTPEEESGVQVSRSQDSIRSNSDDRRVRNPERRSFSRSRSRSPSYRDSRSRSRSSHGRSRTRSPSPRRRRSHSRSRSRDRGPYRARGDRYNPEKCRCLGVFGLSFMTTERDLANKFSRYGHITDVQLIYDRQTNRSRGFGFVYFERDEDAAKAKDRTNGTEFDGRCIRVDFSITKRAHTPTPGIYMGEPASRSRRRSRSRSPYRRRSRSRSPYGRRRSRSRSPRRRRSPSPRRRSRSPSYDRRRRRSYSR